MQIDFAANVHPISQLRWRSRYAYLAIATTMVIFGLAIRIRFLNEPLWIDELHTAWVAGSASSDVGRRAGQGNQTPLYFWLVHAVCHFAGTNEFTLRLPSLMFSAGLILAAFQFVWQLTRSTAAALLTTTLISLDPWCIFYATEARPYALLQCLGIGQAFGWSREWRSDGLSNPKKINWILLTSTAALLLTHLTSLFLVAAQVALVIMFKHRLNWKRILFTISLACIPLLPCIAIGRGTLEKRHDWIAVSNAANLLKETIPYLSIYLLLPVVLLNVQRYLRDDSLGRRLGNSHDHADRQNVAIMVVGWGLGPLLVACLLDGLEILPVAHFRYIVVGWIALPIWAGLMVARIDSRIQRTAVASLVLVVGLISNPICLGVIRDGGPGSFRNEDWLSTVAELRAQEVGRQPLVFLFANLVEDRLAASPRSATIDEYLKFPLASIYPLPVEATIEPMPTRTSQRWSWEHLQKIHDNGGAQIVARVSINLLAAILQELHQRASECELVLRYKVKTQDHNRIAIAHVYLSPNTSMHRALKEQSHTVSVPTAGHCLISKQ